MAKENYRINFLIVCALWAFLFNGDQNSQISIQFGLQGITVQKIEKVNMTNSLVETNMQAFKRRFTQTTEEFTYLHELNSPCHRQSASDINIIQLTTISQPNKSFKKFKSFVNSNSTKSLLGKYNRINEEDQQKESQQKRLNTNPSIGRIFQISYIPQKKRRVTETSQWKHFLELNEKVFEDKVINQSLADQENEKNDNEIIKKYKSEAALLKMNYNNSCTSLLETKSKKKLKFTLKQNFSKKAKSRALQIPSIRKINENQNLASCSSLPQPQPGKSFREVGKIKSNKLIKSIQIKCPQCQHINEVKRSTGIMLNKIKGMLEEIKMMSYNLQRQFLQFKENSIKQFINNLENFVNYEPVHGNGDLGKGVLVSKKQATYGLIDEVIQDISKEILNLLEREYMLGKVEQNSKTGKIVKNMKGDSTNGQSSHKISHNSDLKVENQKQEHEYIPEQIEQKISLKQQSIIKENLEQMQLLSEQEWSRQMIIQNQPSKHSSQIAPPFTLSYCLQSSIQKQKNNLCGSQQFEAQNKLSKSVQHFKMCLNNLRTLHHEQQLECQVQNDINNEYSSHPCI